MFLKSGRRYLIVISQIENAKIRERQINRLLSKIVKVLRIFLSLLRIVAKAGCFPNPFGVGLDFTSGKRGVSTSDIRLSAVLLQTHLYFNKTQTMPL